MDAWAFTPKSPTVLFVWRAVGQPFDPWHFAANCQSALAPAGCVAASSRADENSPHGQTMCEQATSSSSDITECSWQRRLQWKPPGARGRAGMQMEAVCWRLQRSFSQLAITGNQRDRERQVKPASVKVKLLFYLRQLSLFGNNLSSGG